MGEKPFPAIVNLRGQANDKAFMAAAKKVLGVALPKKPQHHGLQGRPHGPLAGAR